MPNHLLNLPLLLQIIQRLPCETAIDLQPVHERGDCDETVGLDIFVEFIGGSFVENNGVVGLVLDCSRRAESVGRCLGPDRYDPEGLEMKSAQE